MPHTNREANALHVVLGAGQVGPRLAELLLARGHRVRVVRRGEANGLPGVEHARADLTDVDAATRACEGASVVYDTTNPASYSRWNELLPPLKRGVRAAASRTGAFLVTLDNLYAYGVPEAGVLTEDTPLRPVSDKGRLRAELHEELATAIARGELSGTVGRASDFYGPGAGAMSFYGDRLVRGLASGWGTIALGDPDLPRSYSYVPDVVRGLAALGDARDRANGRVFHLPVAWKDGSTRDFVGAFAKELGVRPRMWRMRRWAFHALGVFSRDLGAVAEMIYQWETPYVVDDRRIVREIGVAPTRIEASIRASVDAAGVARRGAPRLAAGDQSARG